MVEYIVISDTSCLVLLEKIEALWLLPKVYHHIIITPEVAQEFKKTLPAWVEIIPVINKNLVSVYNEVVDLGEASSIALAHEIPDPLIIVDDNKGRRLARQLKIRITGTIGVLVTARKQNIIDSLTPYFELVRSTNFRIDPSLLDKILNEFNE